MSREENFKKDFSDLLRKYNAEFDVDVEMTAFGAHVEGISVYIPADEDNESVTIKFTKWFDVDL